jgi:hypothetical protein
VLLRRRFNLIGVVSGGPFVRPCNAIHKSFNGSRRSNYKAQIDEGVSLLRVLDVGVWTKTCPLLSSGVIDPGGFKTIRLSATGILRTTCEAPRGIGGTRGPQLERALRTGRLRIIARRAVIPLATAPGFVEWLHGDRRPIGEQLHGDLEQLTRCELDG